MTVEATTPTDRTIVLSRRFDAPPRLVFDAWTKPELLRRWYGARGWTLVECEVDLRVDGAWRFVSHGPDGARMGQRGVYREVDPPHRLVYTELFDDQSYPGVALVTHDFTEESGRTLATSTILYPSPEARDIVLRYPMRRGVGEAFERLDQVLKDATVVATRVFDAPVERVWSAWADPADVRRWWGAPGFTVPRADIDFRVGGTALLCMSSPDYGDLYNTWHYERIVPHERIEFVLKFTDVEGVPLNPRAVGIPPGVPAEVPHVVLFRTLAAEPTEMPRTEMPRTELTVTEYGYTAQQAAEISRIGLEHCLDKMTALIRKG